MESLLACYASDDDEVDAAPQIATGKSLFSSLPQPRKRAIDDGDVGPSASGLFGSLPAPKKKNSKGVVEFRPPIDISVLEEEDRGEKRQKQQAASREVEQTVIGGLVLPPPKNSSLGMGLGSGRRTRNLEQKIPAFEAPEVLDSYPQQFSDVAVTDDPHAHQRFEGFDGAEDEDLLASRRSYGVGEFPAAEDPAARAMKQERRRGRDEGVKFLEIKQSDLTANRPREDQLRMTGIAFGPAFEKREDEENRPTKLHKRKHQIGSLYYDMRQKEFELMERRARGQVSKSQTLAKYGW